MKHPISFIFLLAIISAQTLPFYMWINNTDIISDAQYWIYNQGAKSQYYTDEIFKNNFNCKNGNLEIINNTYGDKLVIEYANVPEPFSLNQIIISVQPNQQPVPSVVIIDANHFDLNFNCKCNGIDTKCNQDNYYNKVNVKIRQFQFAFLLNCDPDTRHKNFQLGYIIISLLSSMIIIGVAMHSHIWSFKIKLKPMRIQLKWKFVIIATIMFVGIILLIFLINIHQFQKILKILRTIGIIYSIFFVFLCFNQTFFLIKKLRKQVVKIIRICDIMSVIGTIAAITVAFFEQNWLYNDILTGCICIGSVKLFHFSSLKQAIAAIMIMVVSLVILVTIMHFTLPRSYNDYTGQLSTPFVLQVPDLINNIYKKCSWLSNTDIVLPGVMLSYLRLYDQNKGSKYGGIYTISGNVTFVLSTLLWITIELVYPFSVPFSLITDTLLILVIFIIAYKRNQWQTIFRGTFQQGYNTIDEQALRQQRKSYSQHVPPELMNETLIQQQNIHNSLNVN